ncbi:hypothetical protein HHK36_000795 [Tetracentron sinense]|uniref:Uncharacterized protein n=1 Tax=Tetracentron sinense TaxID=13715 RepID=A0A834ZS56_TETSI|nr:hypothetical protein HHK36_000795 [Tetracentron sinense]
MLYADMIDSISAPKFELLQYRKAWMQLSSPCFWEDVSIVLQLGFLVSLLIHFVLKKVVPSCTKRSKITEKKEEEYHIGVKFGLSYKASIGCSIFLLGSHFLMLLMLLNGNEAHCKSTFPVLSAEIMQVISWSITLVAVSSIWKARSVKLPPILRAWWLCNFIQSVIRTSLDSHSILTHHGIPGVGEYADFLGLLASTYLLCISIRGTTGISFVPNGITEPLLNGNTEKHAEGKRESLYGRATLLQLITFSWLNALFAAGIKKPLEQDEIPDVDIKDAAGFLSRSFDESLKHVKERDGTTNPSIYKAILLFVRKKAALNALFAVISAGASYVGPYLIDDFVQFLSGKKNHSLESGYLLALAFLSAKMVEMVAQRQWIFGARQLGLRLRAALISQIYKKGLHLSSQSRQSHTSGEIINYMSVDIQRITDFIWYLNIIWMLPIQISLAIYILNINMGLGSLAGLAATAMVMACNIPITRIQKRFQSKIMEAKDDRMKATSEILRNMKTLKLQAWDSQYLHKLEILRENEYNWLWKSLRLSAISAFIFWGSPTFISVVTFGACMLMGIPLTAGRVLSALATFRMLQDPIFNLPDLLSVLAQAKVSVDRVASYLQDYEIQSDAVMFVPKDESGFEIEIDTGKFSWNPESGSLTLDGIQLKVKRGMKVAICGTVGSGKSSLLSCILGEIPKLSGTVKISGTKAYVPQSPWILTGNVRENILFGNPYDSAKYDRTVKACALKKDFELFGCGDLTEIGERGINMSGGQKQRIQIARAVYQDADIYLLDDPFSAVDAHTGTQLFEDCLMGILKDKTIFYVTHQVEFLPAADLILVMQNGRVAQAGRFEELLRQNIGFEVLVGAHSEALESILTVKVSSKANQRPIPDSEADADVTANAELLNGRQESEHNLSLEITDKAGILMQDEEREKGSIGKEVYLSYLTAVRGGALVPIILLAQSLFQVLQVASNYWMAWASPPTIESEPMVGMNILFLVYILLAVGSSLCVLVRAMLVATAGLLTAQKFFTDMLHSLLRAPMAFFDSTPTGRILNRVSTDQSVLDLELVGKLGWCAFSVIMHKEVKITEKKEEEYHIGVKFGLSYKASIGCSIFLLGSHFLMLLMLLNGNEAHCKSTFPVLSAEIMQVISWSITLVAVSSIWKARSVKLPPILRAWWLCNFIQSVIRTSLDSHSILTHHGIPGVGEYADFLGLLASTYLLCISIRGTTGISFVPNGITEPLLNGNTEKHAEGKRESLYGRATLLQLITFSWLNALFAAGIKKPLEQDEIPDVDIKDAAGFLSRSFDESLKHVKERDGTTNPSIYKAILLFVRKKAALNALFAVISAGASYVGPYLIDDFVQFLSGKKNHSLESGYLLALAFLSAKMVEMVAQRQWIFGARQLGLRLRAALISQIYKKGLHLSSQSRQSHTSGEIINYMSVDIQRITDFIWYLNIIWMLPIQISLAIYILNINMGLGSLAGLAATAMVMACNIPITRIQKRFQSKIMEAKDDRMKATSEILRNMKTLKLQAWDSQYLHKLEILRENEYNWLWKSLRLSAISAFIFWGSPTFISVVTFGACMLMGIPLTAGRVLSALATFRMLQDPIFNLPDLLSVLAQAKVSVDRVASYLQDYEIQSDAVMFVPKDESGFEIEIDTGKFSWNPESGSLTLDGIQLKVKRGMKVAICGTVGSGKSSLLSCILGEIPKLSGTVKISGTKAYVPQSPWILTGNVRENILFGNPYDSAKYDRTVKACALKKDFELFGCGDLTEIGERGINMSGGQKQRIQIARAVYQDADIYLLDDPFSAVDAHTGTQLFEDCLMGILKDKTIFYVTHQVEFLPAADLILVMQNGRVAQAGRFEELLRQNIGFEVLVGAHSEALESILTVKVSSKANQRPIPDSEADADVTANAELLNGRQESEHNLSLEITDKAGILMQDEEREKGSIGKEVYLSYLTAVRGGALVPIILLAQSLFQVLQVASNYWMAWASPPTIESEPMVGMNILFLVYTSRCRKFTLCVGPSHASSNSRPSDSTKVSTDQSVLDLELVGKLGWCAFSVIQILGTIAVMSQVAWQVFVIFIPVTAVCVWYQQYYIPTARELARLSGIQRAPILHHFAESLSGAATIRAFDQEDRFINANLGLIDNHSRPWFHNVSAMEWLSFRLNLLSNFVFAFSLVLLVSLPEGIINPSIAGLAVTYGLNLNVQQASIIWNICNAENKMISVERILQYSKLNSEAPLLIEECRPPNNWPEIGTICFKNLQIRYAEHLPSVLKDITCTFPGRMKIGVVGRTGSGKSTLIQAIFRIVEPREGSIVIDDVDICKIGLHDLRSRLSIIPQDPTMFAGTVRGNLDPLEQHSDNEIWEALDKCQLGTLVRAKEEKLDSTVVENGENWSVGQRQLFCLGRALLKKSSILVLDEATASVDSATDGEIQKIISQEFKDRTVLTIAHRIHTVIDSDLVLVLSEGRVAEYDTPAKLLEREDSFFSKLIKEYSMRSQSFNSLVNL